MRTKILENPVVPFATSIGAAAVQVVGFCVGAELMTIARDLRDIWTIGFIAIFLVPLVSIVGIVSAIVRLKKKMGVGISSVGLLLNVLYLAAFVLVVISGSQPNAWNF